MNHEEKIVLFDGHCVLCNGFARFLIKRNRNKIFKLGTIQSEKGRQIIAKYKELKGVDSIVLFMDNKVFTKSKAALRIFAYTPYWKWTQILRIFPPVILDYIYDVIAGRRYKWFGRNDVCKIPSQEEKEHYL